MIFFDVTKSRKSAQPSGIMRVSRRLLDELGPGAQPVVWRSGRWRRPGWRGAAVEPGAADWLLTVELFCEEERPGFSRFVRDRRCRLAAVFHDAIPLKHPAITWPQSVARHPAYMSLLADFDRVFAVSAWSWGELTSFWQWQGREARAEALTVALGADFFPGAAREAGAQKTPPRLLCVGIVEPRKNQSFLLDVCAGLWDEGLDFELHIAGRVNPRFGGEIERKILAMQKVRPKIKYHRSPDDAALLGLFRSARAAVFPTLAEGCGLPPLEALWLGVPCVCSNLPVLREYTGGGGCVTAAPGDHRAWASALRRVLTDDVWHDGLRAQAAGRELPTWAGAAAQILACFSA
ncbi:MAG: glycosyltransferase [Opitutaceae bacterium]|jgi:glycosyltransferase involved in cell wall biosynthesis|nr:glycosyltransferase [Opitutaceae bacterium]